MTQFFETVFTRAEQKLDCGRKTVGFSVQLGTIREQLEMNATVNGSGEIKAGRVRQVRVLFRRLSRQPTPP